MGNMRLRSVKPDVPKPSVPRFIDLSPEGMVVREVVLSKGYADVVLADSINSSAYSAVTLRIPRKQKKLLVFGQAVVAWFSPGGGSQPVEMVQSHSGELFLPYYGLVDNAVDPDAGYGNAQIRWDRERLRGAS